MTSVIPEQPPRTGSLIVALAGNPNVGKTTLFNALTGLKQKVANYPGVTVEKKLGRCTLPGHEGECQVVDLPGTYSLASRSPDEHVARQVVLGQLEGEPRPDVIVVVADASNLERNLYLVTQVLELGRPTVVALSMVDVAESRGQQIDVAGLARMLGTPVVPVAAHRGGGVEELKQAMAQMARRGSVLPLQLPLPAVMDQHVARLKAILTEEKLAGAEQAHFDAHLMLTTGDDEEVADPRRAHPRVREQLRVALAECEQAQIDPIAAEIDAHYGYIGKIVEHCVTQAPQHTLRRTRSDRLDHILTHKVWGVATFVGIMALVFWSIFSLAQPVMKFLQDTCIGGLGAWIGSHMSEGPLQSLLVDGVIAGVGNVVVFLPQIALLFLFLGILEDSGYMSRAAFLMDRLMSKVGLHGKSFIPLLSGFACAVPAIMGTRVIENRRDRLATILILPLMSCSARLPVYMLLIALFFGSSAWTAALVLLSMYLLGTLSAFGLAWVFKRTLLKGPPPAFILEMPPYHVPHWRTVLTTVGQRSWHFLERAGTLIFAFSVVMWAATHYPKPAAYSQDFAAQIAALEKQGEETRNAKRETRNGGAEPRTANREPRTNDTAQASSLKPQDPIGNRQSAIGNSQGKLLAEINEKIEDLKNAQRREELEASIAGRAGHAIAPAFYPLGYDWKTSVGVIGAFFAREVIVSTMGIVYSVGEVERGKTEALQKAMHDDEWPAGSRRAGQKVWTPLTALSLMVFVVFCMQCLSTLSVAKRETGHWGWPVFMFVYMTGLAYVAALAVYQGGHWLGWQ